MQQDAFFAPTTQTPYTDDFSAGYQVDLGRNMSFEAAYTNRRTRDILEDYDLGALRAIDDGTTDYPGPIDRSAVALAGSRLFRLHRESGIELRHRDAERRQAELPGRRPDLPQALQQQLAAARLLHL